jgi:hypothetical protein
MNITLAFRLVCPRIFAWPLLVLLTGFVGGAFVAELQAGDRAQDRASSVGTRHFPQPKTGDAGMVARCPSASLPLAAGWWQETYGRLESFLNTRQRMLQFGAVAMGLALFIIWYRR